MYILSKRPQNNIVASGDTADYVRYQRNGYYVPCSFASATHTKAEGTYFPVPEHIWREVETLPEGFEADGTWLWSEGEIRRDEALTSTYLRTLRDEKISETDWMVAMDSPLEGEALEKAKEYRQKLRDFPQQEGFPFGAVFPEW